MAFPIPSGISRPALQKALNLIKREQSDIRRDLRDESIQPQNRSVLLARRTEIAHTRAEIEMHLVQMAENENEDELA